MSAETNQNKRDKIMASVSKEVLNNEVLNNKDITEAIKALYDKNPLETYEKIAQSLNFAAKQNKKYAHPQGYAWSAVMISNILISKFGIRRKCAGITRKRHSTIKSSSTPSARLGSAPIVVTKWEMLKAIEGCTDLVPSTRKAILDLVWRELHK
jgi:hypothetical protein